MITKKLFPLLTLILTVTSCHHKDLCFDHTHTLEVNVVFDWRNAPDAEPASMSAYFFNASGETAPLRYIFTDRYGGHIDISHGQYSALCMNADDTDWAHLRNMSDIESSEIYTAETDELSVYGLSARSVPRAEGAEDERIVATPGMLWADRQDSIAIPYTDSDDVRTITLYPEECVCHYTVDILDVENLKYVSGGSVDATVSGMSEGFLYGKRKTTDTRVTLPFTMKENSGKNALHGEFLTFGESQDHDYRHVLSVYMYLTDGSKWYYNFDVTDQIHTAPDPRHVHIVVSGLKLPHPISSGGGLIPEVDDWQTEKIDISM